MKEGVTIINQNKKDKDVIGILQKDIERNGREEKERREREEPEKEIDKKVENRNLCIEQVLIKIDANHIHIKVGVVYYI